MRITAVETHIVRVKFDMGAAPRAFAGGTWSNMDTLFVRVVTDQGVEGWGEGFGHAVCPATRAAFDTQVGPAALGQDVRDIRALMARLLQQFHLYGRNGPLVYALSALDIALWDIAGKAAGLPLCRLLGGSPATTLNAYASLLRYGEPHLVGEAVGRAAAQGYKAVKLHEIDVPQVAAARRALGSDVKLMLDVNCPWTVMQSIEMAKRLRDYDLHWLEEPVFPPEDHTGLARVRREAGIAISAGENAAGLHDFLSLFEAGAIDNAQPSVTKIGGITEVVKIAALAEAHSVRLVSHCAYFGPGYLASLHLNASLAPEVPFERIFVDLEASPYHELVTAPGGKARVPDGPGLGRDPDPAVMQRFRLGEPTVLRA
jgi:D-galactarolactone cycloisomerase